MKRVVLLAVILFALLACGGAPGDLSEKSSQQWVQTVRSVEGTPLELGDATLVADALATNAAMGAAAYRIVLPAADGDFELMAGAVDFAGVVGIVNAGSVLGGSERAAWVTDSITIDGRPATQAEGERLAIFIGALHVFGAARGDNPVLVQQNGTLNLVDTDDVLTVAVEGNRDAVMEIDRATGTVTRAMLSLAHPMLPGGHGTVVISFDFEQVPS